MGAVIPQFPAGVTSLCGVTPTLLNQTGSGTWVFFTAPTSGAYIVYPLIHLVSTDNVGTLSTKLTTPHSPTNLVLTAANIAAGQDQASAGRMCWLNAGESITATTTATGLTGTTFDLVMTVFQVL